MTALLLNHLKVKLAKSETSQYKKIQYLYIFGIVNTAKENSHWHQNSKLRYF